jgi:uncharacterized membrane protein
MKQWYYAKGKERLGPFQKSHVVELYQQGTIAPGDLVWEEGTADWVTAASVFGSLPAAESGVALPGATEAPAADGKLHPFWCIERGWKLVWKYPAELIGGVFIAGILMAISSTPSYIGSFMMNPEMAKAFGFTLAVKAGFTIYLGGLLINLIIGPLIVGGVFWMMLRAVRGEKPDLTDLFYPFKKFAELGVPLILANLLRILLIILGFICFIIPGIWLSVRFMFISPAIVDTQPGIRRALERSSKLIQGNWWRAFGFYWLAVLVILLGYAACCVGVIIALPVAAAAFIYAYDDLAKLKP